MKICKMDSWLTFFNSFFPGPRPARSDNTWCAIVITGTIQTISSMPWMKSLFDQDGWDKLGGNLPPPKQLWKELGLVQGSFAHLENLPDHGHLRVLRNKFQIVEAGKKLHNCLRHDSGYVKRVEQKEILLVCLDDDNGKPIAVGSTSLRSQMD